MKRDILDESPRWLDMVLLVVLLLILAAAVFRGCRRWGRDREIVIDVVLPVTADSLAFAMATPPDRRPAIARYIASVTAAHGNGPVPEQAANQLVYLESVGGAKAELVAALVWAESRWDCRTRNLGQVLPSTSRCVYGHMPRRWTENLYQTSTYLRGCIDAELDARHPEPVRAGLARYNGGPGKPPVSWAYARRVLRERAAMP